MCCSATVKRSALSRLQHRTLSLLSAGPQRARSTRGATRTEGRLAGKATRGWAGAGARAAFEGGACGAVVAAAEPSLATMTEVAAVAAVAGIAVAEVALTVMAACIAATVRTTLGTGVCATMASW